MARICSWFSARVIGRGASGVRSAGARSGTGELPERVELAGEGRLGRGVARPQLAPPAQGVREVEIGAEDRGQGVVDGTPGGPDIFEPMRDLAEDYDAILMANHGAVTFGTDGATAGEKSYYFDDIDVGAGGGAPGGGELLTNGDFEASDADKAPWINAGGIATNNFYTADALDGEPVFQTNLSQVVPITQGAEYLLTFRARASVARDIIAGIGLNGGTFTADTATAPLTTEWQSYSFNLTAVADIGTAESRVLFDMGGVTSTVNIDDVSLSEATGGGGGGGAIGELAINGGFETGDFTGWEISVNGGTITTTSDSSAGSFAANLNITAAGNPTLKAANLGAGSLTPGQQVTVSFDWKGSDANGGVVDAVLFSELSGGGVSQTDQILSGAGFPADWTTVGPLTINLGPDVSGGVTLQFTAICGAVAGCVSDIFIDNVSIVAN